MILEHTVLWLILTLDHGLFRMCYYSEQRPTVMQPFPDVYMIRAHDRRQIADGERVCPVRMIETVDREDVA